jgi:predicted enzyme related to lactoylglutathione lyase
MTSDPSIDPFWRLRESVVPVDPDPGFAAALRERLVRAVLDPGSPTSEAPVTSILSTPTTNARVRDLTAYLAVVDARAAVDFYVASFGATRRADPIVMPDGRVGHVEVAIGDSVLMLADEFPEIGLVAPVNRGGPTGSVRVEVPDPDAAVAAALAAGATLDRPVTDSPYGRGGTIIDASGHRWMVSKEVPTVRQGDVVYTSIQSRDVDATVRFFSAVLGWEFGPVHETGTHRVTNLATHIGVYPTDGAVTTFPCVVVDDVDAAVAIVRAAGGTAGEPEVGPYGRLAECADDQGLQFALMQNDSSPVPPAEHGSVTYLERRSPDVAGARAFYGSVLGTRFVPGSDAGYWHPEGSTHPFSGLTSADTPSIVATYGVRDLDAALAAVAEAGGHTEHVEDRGPARTAACVDDQGMPFGLQQL